MWNIDYYFGGDGSCAPYDVQSSNNDGNVSIGPYNDLETNDRYEQALVITSTGRDKTYVVTIRSSKCPNTLVSFTARDQSK